MPCPPLQGNKTASARLTLGLPLTIDLPGGKAEQYEELDEVLARFVEPLMDNVRVGGWSRVLAGWCVHWCRVLAAALQRGRMADIRWPGLE